MSAGPVVDPNAPVSAAGDGLASLLGRLPEVDPGSTTVTFHKVSGHDAILVWRAAIAAGIPVKVDGAVMDGDGRAFSWIAVGEWPCTITYHVAEPGEIA